MGVGFEQGEGYLLVNLSGDYRSSQDYRNDSAEILRRLGETPTRVILNLQGLSGINRKGLTGLEKLCWKVAKDCGQEIRLASPSERVKQLLEKVDFTIPIYETVSKADESFEDDDFLEDGLFDNSVKDAEGFNK